MPRRKVRTDSLDRALEALSHAARRRVLSLVSERVPRDGTALTFDDMLAEVDDAEGASIGLYHVHLPKLHWWGYIEWDPDAREVRRGPRFDEIAPLLELVGDPGTGLDRR